MKDDLLPLPVTAGPSGSSNLTFQPSTPFSSSSYPPQSTSSSTTSTSSFLTPSRTQRNALSKLSASKLSSNSTSSGSSSSSNDIKGKGKSIDLTPSYNNNNRTIKTTTITNLNYDDDQNKDEDEDKYEAMDDVEVDEEELLPRGVSFSIRFTEGVDDLLELFVGEQETVREVKRRIRYLRPSLTLDGRPRRLRLIILGRILTDGILLVDYTVKLLSRRAKLVQQEIQGNSETILDALVGGNTLGGGGGGKNEKSKGKSKEKKEWNALAGTEAENEGIVWLHCSVGEAMEDEEIEGERIQKSDQIIPLQGFDRLLDAGFNITEINEMRQEFRSSQGSTQLPSSGLVNGQDEDDHARALEDQWMEGLTAGQTEVVETEVYSTLLKGVCLGFFFPFLPLFFFRTQIFSKRLQMACILGIFLNCAFGLLRFFS